MSRTIEGERVRREAISQYETPEGYTHNDFLELCKGREDIAEVVFQGVDWQSPEAYYIEMLEDEEICQYYGITD